MMEQIKQAIPEDFILGAAASAWQTEGWTGKKTHRIPIWIFGIKTIKMFGIMAMDQASPQTFIIDTKKILI